MIAKLALDLPPSRPARITAEIFVGAHGSLDWYGYIDGDQCIGQGTALDVEEAQRIVRERFSVEPIIIRRKPYVKKAAVTL